jgi:hypothetical protein
MLIHLINNANVTDPTVKKIVECWKKHHQNEWFTESDIPEVSPDDLLRAVSCGLLNRIVRDDVNHYCMPPHVFYNSPAQGIRPSVESFTNFTEMKDQGYYTAEEVEDQFVGHVVNIKEHCVANLHGSLDSMQLPPDIKVQLLTIMKGTLGVMCHNFLVMIDGEAGSLPAFNLHPHVVPGDKDYYTARGEKHYDASTPFNIDLTLHETYNTKDQ